MQERMRCLVLDKWDSPLRASDRPIPDVGPTDVLVEVEATGLGRTVANAIRGEIRGDDELLPLIPGHEIVGCVVETGDAVEGPTVGSRVGAYFYLSCGRCDACYAGWEALCTDSDGLVGVDVDGGFAEYVRLPSRNTIRIPDGIDAAGATIVPDAVATSYHVCNTRLDLTPGDEVAILGAGGGVGIHLLQVAEHFGADVTAVDKVAEKLRRCKDLGAVKTIDTSEQPLKDALVGGGAAFDVVVDFTSSMDLLTTAAAATRPRGTVVNMTAPADATLAVDPRRLVRDEQTILGSRYCSKLEFRSAARLVDDGVVEPVVTKVVGLEGIPDILETIHADQLLGRGAVTP